jgi:transmembrane sensor
MAQSKEYTRYEELASKCIDRAITPEEEQEFSNWFNREQDQPLVVSAHFAVDYDLHKNRIFTKILEAISVEDQPARKLWRYIPTIAAILVMAVAASIYFYGRENRHYDIEELASNHQHGSSVAVWTDENGKETLLDDSVYYAAANVEARLPLSNAVHQIATPKGGHYKIILEDGTKVWINADTKLIYPVVFNKSERTVKLSGEAYFEVSHNPERPFHVQVVTSSSNQDLTVLGTKFNLSGYHDEKEIKTTVYEGAVRVKSGKKQIVLSAGTEVINHNNQLAKVLALERKVSWINGDIIIDGDIYDCMRKVSRLYNVKIVYDGVFTHNGQLAGVINSKRGLEVFIRIIEATGLYRFNIEGDKVIVSSNFNN